MGELDQIGPYDVIKNLGEGTSAKVKLAVNRLTGQNVAIKIIKKAMFATKVGFERKIRREIALMKFLDHPHCIRLIEVFESTNHLFMILEYAGNGELFDYLVSRTYLRPDAAMNFFRQIIYAIDFLHSHQICHRDLKPENILLDDNLQIKLADFGFARWMKENIAETSCGSPHYAAPEVIKGLNYDGRIADIWSCGVILFALLNGYLPFDDPSIRNVLSKVKSGHYEMPDIQPSCLQDLIKQMLTVDPTKRITIPEIKAHPAFRLFLPQGYKIPKPLPIPKIIEEVDLKTVDPNFYVLMRHIGYSNDEEVKTELTSKSSTTAKIFHYMLTSRANIALLPWESEEEDPSDSGILIDQEKEESFFDPRFVKGYETGSPSHFSYRASTPWGDGISEKDTVLEYRFDPVFTNYIEIATAMQRELESHGFQYFYPNDFLLIVHSPQDSGYYIISMELAHMVECTVVVQCINGDELDFKAFVDFIRDILTQSKE